MANQLPGGQDNLPASESVRIRPASGGLLRWLVPMVLLLIVVGAVVWNVRPKPMEVYTPPPRPVRTLAETEASIAEIKNSKKIPAGDKARILGFMQAELEKARERETNKAKTP